MPIETDEEFEAFITAAEKAGRDEEGCTTDKAAAESEAPGGRKYPGRGTYETWPHTVLPPSKMTLVYFYYFKFQPESGKIRTMVYEGEISDGKLPHSTISTWITDARKGGTPAMVKTRNPNNVGWNGPCYLVFFMDNESWQLWEKEAVLRGDVSVRPNHSLYFSTTQTGKKKNETFFNAETVEINISGELVNVLSVENHHLRPDKGDAPERRDNGDPDDEYKFDIYYRVSLDPEQNERLTMVVDPTSRNTGP